ncbi:hypothetical protein LTS08_007057 [Lithohypha guttulata]|uniref:AN1-type zinc finger protein TMC1 n=1 Tax=Lithohypha guttulata TaxID=1690604 RepID=A0AAN7T0D6_9EURO|nr:hypothetical protein LTR05_003815 [Lithohypha guttulata]KAK5097037.1 hypothetical protein LTS08_007057 [Lithohypha guttulata]
MDAQTSSRSSSPSTDHIQIVVNTTPGKSIPLKVSPTHTIANVLEFLSASITLPLDSKLVLAGKQLDPSTTVGELNLVESPTLNLFTPSQRNSQEPESSEITTTLSASQPSSSTATSGTSTPTSTKPAARKSNKPRCTKDGCKAPAQPIVGDCGFCQQRFCGKHRMLESHNCPGLADARQADKDRNTARLEHERTVTLRGL